MVVVIQVDHFRNGASIRFDLHLEGSIRVDLAHHYICPGEAGIRDTFLGGRHHPVAAFLEPSLELTVVIKQVSK